MKRKGIGVYTSSLITNADHLVPLCQLMEIPILTPHFWISEVIDLYYPEMPLITAPCTDYCLDESLKNYDLFFYVNASRMPTGTFRFMEYFYRGGGKSVCGFHGNSDKKQTLYWLEKYADEEVVLAYGQHLIDFFQEKGILKRVPKFVRTGNFRFEYYLKHQAFFDAKMAMHLFPPSNKKTILYAPTWTQPNRNSYWRNEFSSFFQDYPFILDAIPEGYQVIVKLHPMLVHFYSKEIDEIKEKYQNENILFLNDFPLIYPLLSKVDIYIGDYSSIGYDFLTFNRPLYFLSDGKRDPKQDKGVFLYNAGTTITPQSLPRLYQILEMPDQKKAERASIYEYAFGERKDLQELKKEIEAAYT